MAVKKAVVYKGKGLVLGQALCLGQRIRTKERNLKSIVDKVNRRFVDD